MPFNKGCRIILFLLAEFLFAIVAIFCANAGNYLAAIMFGFAMALDSLTIAGMLRE